MTLNLSWKGASPRPVDTSAFLASPPFFFEAEEEEDEDEEEEEEESSVMSLLGSTQVLEHVDHSDQGDN